MWSILASWTVVGIIVAIIIGIGGVAMSVGSYLLAKICFNVAILIFLSKFGIWMSSESYPLKWRIVVSFMVFGLIGTGWVLSLHWVNITAKKEAIKAYVGRLQSEKKIIFSVNDHILPMLEIGDSNTGFVWKGPQGAPILNIFGDNDVKIELEGGQIKVSTLLRNRKGQIIAELVKNEWKVSPPPNTWDRNYSRDALEVLDPTGDIVLQVRLVENRVQLQAKFIGSNGQQVGLIKTGPHESVIEFEPPSQPLIRKIKPIFKYPSELHFGEFVDIK
jgi:hypothetical protein